MAATTRINLPGTKFQLIVSGDECPDQAVHPGHQIRHLFIGIDFVGTSDLTVWQWVVGTH